jgi:hypothetical protein
MADEPTTSGRDESPRGKRPWLIAVVVAAVVLIAALGVFSYMTWTQRSDAARRIDEATNLVERADQVVVEVDEVVRAEISSQTAAAATAVTPKVPEAAGLLREAIEILDGSATGADDAGRERADALKEAALARLDMLSQAPTIIEATRGASDSLPLGADAWERTLQADTLGKRAVAAYNKLNKAGVTESSRLNKSAATELAAARAGMDAAEKAFPAAVFEGYLAYLDLRIEMNVLSQQSDAAWLKGELGVLPT